MNLYERAREVYAREECARAFEEDLYWHLTCGYVVSTPTAFAMARPVRRDWPVERLLAPWETDAEGDTWWVWLHAGDMAEGLGHLPGRKKWLAFERRGHPRFREYDRFLASLRRTGVVPGSFRR